MAGRIPESFIEDIIARTDLVELISSRVKLKRAGKNYSACCPFHQEKTPSFTVSPQKQFYYCFGCGASGNAVGFIMDFDRLGFVEAVESLAKNLGMEVPREDQGPQTPNRKPLYDLLEQASEYYRSQLTNPQVRERAVSYLKRRGLTGAIARDYAIGFAPPGWDNLIKHLDADQRQQELLVEAGLAVKNERGRIYDRFRDRILFPIRDPRGRTIGFGGRVLGDDKPKYLNSPETPVFHKSRELYGLYEARQSLRNIDRYLVVEGYMDVVALAQFDIHYAVATLGTASNSDHLEKLFKQVNEVVFCFDGDTAGHTAAKRALENAIPTLKDGREVKFLFLPDGEDPDTMVRDQGQEVFTDLIENAQPLSEFFYDTLSTGLNVNSLDGKARLAKLAAPQIQRIPHGVFRQLMLDKLANLTELSTTSLEQHLQSEATPLAPPLPPDTAEQTHAQTQAQTQIQAQVPTQTQAQTDSAHIYRPSKAQRSPYGQRPNGAPVTSLVDTVIRLALLSPREAAQLNLPQDLNALGTPYSELLKSLFTTLQQHPTHSTASLMMRWHGTQDGEHLAALAAKEFLLGEASQRDELGDALKRLEIAVVEAKLEALIAAGAPDKSALQALLHLKQTLSNPT